MSARTRFEELGPTARRRVLWGALAAALVSTSLLALGQAARVRANLIADATTSAEALVDAALAPVLTPTDAAVPATGSRYAFLAGAVERQVLTDGTVRAVTIWAGDGTILFADDVSLVGDEVRAMRTTVLSVIGNEPRSDVSRGLLRSFVPIELAPGISVAVELDRSAAPMSSAADPWRVMALVAAAGALLCAMLLARTFTPYGRRVEGFDEDVLRAAVAGHRRAERAREEAESRRDAIAAELEHTRQALHETEQRAREATRTADDTPRLREHLAITAEDLRRAEQERDALRQRLVETGRAVEAEAARGREEVAGALAEIERLEGVKLSLQDRAAKAEESVAELTKQVAELSARPDVEAELASTRREIDATRKDLASARERSERAERRNAELEETADELGARVRDLERRPDLSAKLDAASAALDNAREHIRALTARADASDAEATALRTELERKQAARSEELDEATTALEQARAELERTGTQLRAVMAENVTLQEEAESLRHESDAAGELIAAAKADLLRVTEHAKTLTARAKDAEATVEREREAWAQALEKEHQGASAELERVRADAAVELERVRADVAAELERVEAEAAAELEQVVAERERLEAERTASSDERDVLRSELDALRSERDTLRSERDAAAEEISVFGRTVEELRSALARTGTDLRDVGAVAEGERARADELATERDAAQAETERVRSKLETVRAKLAGSRAEFQRVQAEAERVRSDLDTTRDEADTARAEADTARAEAETASTGAARLQEELERARAEANDTREAAEGSRRELAAIRLQAEALREELQAARTDEEDARALLDRTREEADTTSERADADASAARIASLEREIGEAEARRAEAVARAEEADELLAEAEARFSRTRFAEAVGDEGPVTVSAGAEGLSVAVQPEPTPMPVVNGSRRSNRSVTKVELDTLVRRMVQDTWSDRGRMVSVYAVPVVVEAAPGAIESIVNGLLERSVARTAEGNRIVLHIEREEDGAMLSVEDGRPPDAEAVSAETRRLATELGGWADVEEHLGGGAILRVFLPRSAAAGAGARPA